MSTTLNKEEIEKIEDVIIEFLLELCQEMDFFRNTLNKLIESPDKVSDYEYNRLRKYIPELPEKRK